MIYQKINKFLSLQANLSIRRIIILLGFKTNILKNKAFEISSLVGLKEGDWRLQNELILGD